MICWPKRRRHQVQKLVPDLDLPTGVEEAASPEAADRAYAAFVRVLLDRFRDYGRHPLLFDELCSYGFLRNALGLKWIAVTVATIATLLIVAACLHSPGGKSWQTELTFFGVLLAATVVSLAWWLTLSEERVRVAAEAYADRFFGAVDDAALSL